MMTTRRYCLACDLKNDPDLIAEYKAHHAAVWPEINQSLRDSGIEEVQIYLTGNRLFMIMEVNDSFDPEVKAKMDEKNPKVQEWEQLMWKFQQALPWAKPGEKWVEMQQIYQL